MTRATDEERQTEEMNGLLSKVYDKLSELHTKMFLKPFPFARGIFGEINIT